jgi:hypothetical protein
LCFFGVANFAPEIQIVSAVTHHYNSFTLFQTDKLIKIGVHLYTNLILNAHQGKLKILASPQSGAEVIVFQGLLFNVSYKGAGTVVIKRTVVFTEFRALWTLASVIIVTIHYHLSFLFESLHR